MPVKKSAIADAHAPSATLPLRFVAAGLLALAGAIGWLVGRPGLLVGYHYSPEIVALTHLLVLGFMLSIVMGALYQLAPVALETRLHSERLGRWQFALHLLGVTGMVVAFQRWDMTFAGLSGALFAAGAALFIYNVARTLTHAPRWNVVATSIASALGWLALAVLAGLYVALTKLSPELGVFAPMPLMHAHAHLGVAGVFLILILGVSFKLIPMFTLSELQSSVRAKASIGLVNAGLAAIVAAVAAESAWKLAGAGILIAGLVVYATELGAVLRRRKRRTFDWGLRYLFTALVLLGPLSAVALVLCWPAFAPTAFLVQLEGAYGFLALFGFVALAILGMLFKIVPFLVWHARYSQLIGKQPVPSLADLYSARLQAGCYWLYLPGVAVAALSMAFASETAARWGTLLIGTGLAAFALNMALILSHLSPLRTPRTGGLDAASLPSRTTP